MKNFLKTSWRFIVKSSADPKKISLMVKGFGLMFLTVFTAQIIPVLKIACERGYACAYVEPEFVYTLNGLIELAGDIVYYSLLLASVIAAFIGTARKAWITMSGENETLQNDWNVTE